MIEQEQREVGSSPPSPLVASSSGQGVAPQNNEKTP